ncbi:MAG: VWA domain-containing protein [Pyrinomonadaceae bacterium]
MKRSVKKTAIVGLLFALCGLKTTGQDEGVEISFPISVLSKKGQLQDKVLKAVDIEVFIDKKPQKIKSLVQKDEPLSVGVLVDLSGSIDLRVLPFVLQSITDFVNKSNPNNEYSVISFAQSPTVLLETTRDRKKLQQTLNDLASAKIQGNTAIYEALKLGFEQIKKASYRKSALIVFSDGQDNVSKGVDSDDIRNHCKQSEALIYLIDMNNDVFRDFNLGVKAESFFKDLTQYSGGRRFYPKTNAELKESLETLTAELKNHFVLTFIADNDFKGSKWKKIQVRLSKTVKKELDDVVINTRSGFYFQ